MCVPENDTCVPQRRNRAYAHTGGTPLSLPEAAALHHTFIPGVSKQVVSGAGALLAALIRDGEEGCGGHGLRAAAAVAPLVCAPRGLRVNAAGAAAPLGEGRGSTVTVRNILGLLQNLKIDVFEMYPMSHSSAVRNSTIKFYATNVPSTWEAETGGF